MTKVTFFQKGGCLIGFSAGGHAGAGEYGEDIVCAAISAVTQMVAIAADEVLHLQDAIEMDEESATISVISPIDDQSWRNMLRALQLYLSQLEIEYPENLKVIYTEV